MRLYNVVEEVCKHATAPAPSDRHDFLQVMIHAAMRTHGFVPVDAPHSMLSKQAAAFPLLTYEREGEIAILRSMPMFKQLICYCKFREVTHQLTLRAEDYVHDAGTVMIREHEHLAVGQFVLSISTLSTKLEINLLAKIWPHVQMPQLCSIGENPCQQLMLFLDVTSLTILATTCKAFHRSGAKPSIWCRLCHVDFPIVNKKWACDVSHQNCAANSRQQYIGL
jgi:hypothetical protein